jgi:hypothetical protein
MRALDEADRNTRARPEANGSSIDVVAGACSRSESAGPRPAWSRPFHVESDSHDSPNSRSVGGVLVEFTERVESKHV